MKCIELRKQRLFQIVQEIFKAYKLRTMYDNDFIPKDNKKVGYVENQDEDDRVIPFCKEEIFLFKVLSGTVHFLSKKGQIAREGIARHHFARKFL